MKKEKKRKEKNTLGKGEMFHNVSVQRGHQL